MAERRVIRFPYGIADFRRIRREGMLYVDRTSYIRNLEELGSTLTFLRPRRFGKSLWVQTLATYYDLRYADAFDEIFGGLAVHREPTPLAGRYFVLQWNFSRVTSHGSVEEIAESLWDHVRVQAREFVADYADYLPGDVHLDGSAQSVFTGLLGAVRRAGHPLYLFIDEYDNFVNEVMVQDVETYKALLETDGPFKALFKTVKNATEGQGLERIFVTGVSPVALNDLTSGFNIAEDVSLAPALAGLCGFDETELRALLDEIAEAHPFTPEDVRRFRDVMRVWYNGYRFSRLDTRLVYNPTNALYFLKQLHLYGTPPEDMHDANLRTDKGKLAFLARTTAGTGVVEELTEGTGEIQVSQLLNTFSLGDLTAQLTKDKDAVASFLYYMGLLTQTDAPGHLRIPNLVVRKLFLDRLLELFLPDREESLAARHVAMHFFEDGDLSPLLGFFEARILPVLSNRDQGAPPKTVGQSGSGTNEMTLKALFLATLFDDQRFVLHSELELDKGYADLCLLVRPENAYPNPFDILFEFKLVRRKALGKKGAELRAMDEAELRALPEVQKALDEARGQVERYRDVLLRQRGDAPHPRYAGLRCYAVVAVGLERLLGAEITFPAS